MVQEEFVNLLCFRPQGHKGLKATKASRPQRPQGHKGLKAKRPQGHKGLKATKASRPQRPHKNLIYFRPKKKFNTHILL